MKLQNLIYILMGIVCIGLLPKGQAVVPAPDGGYPGGNTAEGAGALFSLTTGAYNTALGLTALFHDTAGKFNTATGAGALFSNNGDRNTAHGINALRFNTAGDSNTAMGANALYRNNNSFNTAIGDSALFVNNTGSDNTAIGANALDSNTMGSSNTAIGNGALSSNATTNANTAIGVFSLANSTGASNTALGFLAGFAVGGGGNNIHIGNFGLNTDTTTIRIGGQGIQTATFIAGISGALIAGAPVLVSANGQLGVAVSSQRFKDEIKPMDKASEAILALKPVTFRYKKELDPDRIPQFGLVAEEVEKVNPDLVARDEEGKVYTVRYEAVNAMLLNEFLKEHCVVQEQSRKIQEQEATITQLKKDFGATIARLTARLDEQAAQIQRVSAQLEASKPPPQVVNNP
jgi:Chaperone of endosialidase